MDHDDLDTNFVGKRQSSIKRASGHSEFFNAASQGVKQDGSAMRRKAAADRIFASASNSKDRAAEDRPHIINA